MWIIIRGVRYNFNQIGFYYAKGSTVVLISPLKDKDERININLKTPLEANELIEQIDTRTAAQTI